MRRIAYIFSIIILLTSMLRAQSNFTFGVKPGTALNSAYFGKKMNNLIPYLWCRSALDNSFG